VELKQKSNRRLIMVRWQIDYCVGNTYKVKYVYAENAEKAIKKARIKNIVDLNIVDENNKVIG
jgi:hypothetical protein